MSHQGSNAAHWVHNSSFSIKHTAILTYFHSPFTVNTCDLVNIQPEITNLQCDSNMKDTFASVGLDTFYISIPGYPYMVYYSKVTLMAFFFLWFRRLPEYSGQVWSPGHCHQQRRHQQ